MFFYVFLCFFLCLGNKTWFPCKNWAQRVLVSHDLPSSSSSTVILIVILQSKYALCLSSVVWYWSSQSAFWIWEPSSSKMNMRKETLSVQAYMGIMYMDLVLRKADGWLIYAIIQQFLNESSGLHSGLVSAGDTSGREYRRKQINTHKTHSLLGER